MSTWLDKLFQKYFSEDAPEAIIKLLQENDVDQKALVLLSEEDLQKEFPDIKLGNRKKLLKIIQGETSSNSKNSNADLSSNKESEDNKEDTSKVPRKLPWLDDVYRDHFSLEKAPDDIVEILIEHDVTDIHVFAALTEEHLAEMKKIPIGTRVKFNQMLEQERKKVRATLQEQQQQQQRQQQQQQQQLNAKNKTETLFSVEAAQSAAASARATSSSTSSVSSMSTDVDQAMLESRADQAMTERNFVRALNLYARAINVNPKSTPANRIFAKRRVCFERARDALTEWANSPPEDDDDDDADDEGAASMSNENRTDSTSSTVNSGFTTNPPTETASVHQNEVQDIKPKKERVNDDDEDENDDQSSPAQKSQKIASSTSEVIQSLSPTDLTNFSLVIISIMLKKNDYFTRLLGKRRIKAALHGTDDIGNTVLHYACRESLHAPCLQLLMNRCVELGIAEYLLTAKNDQGHTAIRDGCIRKMPSSSFTIILDTAVRCGVLESQLDPDCLTTAFATRLHPSALSVMLQVATHDNILDHFLAPGAKDVNWLFYAVSSNIPVDCFREFLEATKKCTKGINNGNETYLRKYLNTLEIYPEGKEKVVLTPLRSAVETQLNRASFLLLLEELHANDLLDGERLRTSLYVKTHYCPNTYESLATLHLLLRAALKVFSPEELSVDVLTANYDSDKTFIWKLVANNLIAHVKLVIAFYFSEQQLHPIAADALELASTGEMRSLLSDPQCLKKCREEYQLVYCRDPFETFDKAPLSETNVKFPWLQKYFAAEPLDERLVAIFTDRGITEEGFFKLNSRDLADLKLPIRYHTELPKIIRFRSVETFLAGGDQNEGNREPPPQQAQQQHQQLQQQPQLHRRQASQDLGGFDEGRANNTGNDDNDIDDNDQNADDEDKSTSAHGAPSTTVAERNTVNADEDDNSGSSSELDENSNNDVQQPTVVTHSQHSEY